MKALPPILASLAVCGVVTGTILDRAAANVRMTSNARLSGTNHTLAPRRATRLRTVSRDGADPCTSDNSESFAGIPNGSFDIAGGDFSGVVSGENNFACDASSGILSGSLNDVGSTGDDAGAPDSAIGAGSQNTISGGDAFIGAGELAAISGRSSFIGAGGDETLATCSCNGPANNVTATDAFVGAGDLNGISGNGSFIGAGGYTTASINTNTPGNIISGVDSFIGAGDQNNIAATEAFVGSGNANTITSAASYGAILGGARNRTSAVYATVIGGFGNTASGPYAIVAGGDADTASGTLTYAAGYHADAAHNGSFVWSDYVSGSSKVEDSATNQFVARASGGTTFYSNEGATSGVILSAGSGTWANLSDRNAKSDVASLDEDAVLGKVVALPVKTWRYTSEAGVRHVGPMAQDFYAAFGVGEDDRHITSIDEDGIALAAVKGLNNKLERKSAEVGRLRSEVAELRSELRRFEAMIPHDHRSS